LRVLFASSEAHPLIKTGGLADVSGALPKALSQLKTSTGNVDIKVVIPAYSAVLSKLKNVKTVAKIEVFDQACTLIMGKMPDSHIDVIAIENAALYERAGGPYSDENGLDWADNALRFGVLSRVASLLCSSNSPLHNWQPDLIQCNDWQTGLAPAYMKLLDGSKTKSVFSIHNLAFQGNFDASWVEKLGLPAAHFNINGFEYFDQLSFLKAGLFYADKLSTVSPTYAQEIQTSKFGFGLQGLLKTRSMDLTGILNGIDNQEWNPALDVHLIKNYSNSRITGKKAVKLALQQQLGLQIDANAPLLGVVSRLTHQKGLDLLPEIIPKLIRPNKLNPQGCQFAILGSGEKSLEASFNALAERYPTQVSMNTGYHEHLSHNIMAGSDIFVMPSRFEPCGLNQLYGLAYGTPPLVSLTGGLADSVCDTNQLSLKHNIATGFVVKNVSVASLLVTIERAVHTWHDKKTWRQIQKNGMGHSISWDSRAIDYLALYEKTLASN
jgi:starch synthase